MTIKKEGRQRYLYLYFFVKKNKYIFVFLKIDYYALK